MRTEEVDGFVEGVVLVGDGEGGGSDGVCVGEEMGVGCGLDG